MEEYLEEYDDYDEGHFQEHDVDRKLLFLFNKQTLEETVKNCVVPSVTQISSYAGILIGWNVLCRFAWILSRCFNIRPWMDHIISFVCGCGVLYHTIGWDFLIILLFSMVSYVLLSILEYKKSQKMGLTIGSICIVGLFTYELLANDPTVWHKIRGVQMIATMKVISLAFDIDAKKLSRAPALFPFLGYMHCPANTVLGPWVPYDEYALSLVHLQMDFLWILWTTCNTLAAVGFLLLSNCFISLLCADYASRWVVAFRDALSFRCSHYFISFLSQATMAAAGIGCNMHQEVSTMFGHMVTKPLAIEIPRSLTDLVRNWNTSMHRWLKTYIFRTFKEKSPLLAIGATYLVSSLLHGLHFQIYAVLLSLGIFTFVEYELRAKIASIFNACVLPSACRKRACTHEHKWNSLFSLMMNSLFGALTVIHLAYLGIMMDGSSSPGSQENQFSIQAGLNEWMSLDFLSHWIFFCSYLFYLVV